MPLPAVFPNGGPQGNERRHTVTLTGSAAINLPEPGMFLVRVQPFAAAGAVGAFALLYDGQAQAMFGTGGPTVATAADYLVMWPVRGTVVPAASVQFLGSLSGVILTFSTHPNKQTPGIEDYRAIRLANTFGGAGASVQTASWSAAPNKPRSIIAHSSAVATVTVTPPALGAHQQVINAPVMVGNLAQPVAVSDYPVSNSFSASLATDVATTAQAIVYY